MSSDLDVDIHSPPPLTSSDSFFTYGADTLCILLPTAVLPVKEMTETEGCLTMASPARGPVPYTTLHTPAGRPGRGEGGGKGGREGEGGEGGEAEVAMSSSISFIIHYSFYIAQVNGCPPQ